MQASPAEESSSDLPFARMVPVCENKHGRAWALWPSSLPPPPIAVASSLPKRRPAPLLPPWTERDDSWVDRPALPALLVDDGDFSLLSSNPTSSSGGFS